MRSSMPKRRISPRRSGDSPMAEGWMRSSILSPPPGPLEAGVASLGKGGRLVILGFRPASVFKTDPSFRVDPLAVMTKGLEIHGSRYVSMAELIDAVALVKQGKIKPVVTETFPPRRGGKGPSTLPGESDRRAGRPDRLIPIPNQSAILVGFVIGSSSYECIRLRRLFLAALISSLIWNRNKTMCCPDRQRGSTKKKG